MRRTNGVAAPIGAGTGAGAGTGTGTGAGASGGARPVPLGAVQSALERPESGARGRPFLLDLVGDRLGGATALRVELAWERIDQWIFRVTDARGTNGQPALALRVAKAPGPAARLARSEYQHLRALYNVDATLVPLPLAGAVLHVQRPRAAVLFTYVTLWPEGFSEVGYDAHGGLVLHEDGKVRPVEGAAGERLRARLCEILARCYDPARQTAIWPVDPTAGDFVARRDGDDFQARLVSPRGTDRSVPPARLVGLMCDPQWTVGGARVALAPAETALLEEALARGFAKRDGDAERGRERARRYLSAYDALGPGRDRQRSNPVRSSSSTSPR